MENQTNETNALDYDNLERHPLSKLFGRMDAGDYKRLEHDIKCNGLEKRITVYEGQILDGWHRAKALYSIGGYDHVAETFGGVPVAAAFGELLSRTGGAASYDEAFRFVHSTNYAGRNLTPVQKAWIAAKHCQELRYGELSDDEENTDTIKSSVAARNIATVSGASLATIAKCKTIQNAIRKRALPPELGEMVFDGGIAVNLAGNIGSMTDEQLKEILKAKPKGKGSSSGAAKIKAVKSAYGAKVKELKEDREGEKVNQVLHVLNEAQGSFAIWTPPWKHTVVDAKYRLTYDAIRATAPALDKGGRLFMVIPASLMDKGLDLIRQLDLQFNSMCSWQWKGKGGAKSHHMMGLLATNEERPSTPLLSLSLMMLTDTAMGGESMIGAIVLEEVEKVAGGSIDWFDYRGSVPSGYNGTRMQVIMAEAPEEPKQAHRPETERQADPAPDEINPNEGGDFRDDPMLGTDLDDAAPTQMAASMAPPVAPDSSDFEGDEALAGDPQGDEGFGHVAAEGLSPDPQSEEVPY
ncbi:MAG: hypothetical protein ABJH63_10635 [Rhizobiaceae bacterium]